jgi:hypothetical protein
MKVETGNCIVNLDYFIDYTIYLLNEECFLMGTDKNGDTRKYKVKGIKTPEESRFAYNEINMGVEDGLSYVNISLEGSLYDELEKIKDDEETEEAEETEQPHIFAGK